MQNSIEDPETSNWISASATQKNGGSRADQSDGLGRMATMK